ncbi:hypothetical protein PCANB_001996 [Pneumocystis canis]|nr:hypothetical protein PCANB_001996 [Pneumocystis canis]
MNFKKKSNLKDRCSDIFKKFFVNEKKEEKEIENYENNENNDDFHENINKESFSEQEILLSEVESLENLDIPIYQKLTINNQEALISALKTIEIPGERFTDNQVVISKTPIEIKNIHDDFERELAFYKQGLDAAIRGRQAILNEGVPFSRPSDYFAEMLKSDEHMQKVKDKLIQEETEKKAAEFVKKQRELKKIGKMVQVAKIQERQQEKKETLDKIKNFRKRKKGNDELDISDDFNLALEKTNTSHTKQKVTKRQRRDKKYGYGGKKRYKKSNDAESTNNMFEFSVEKMKQQFKPNIKKKNKK